MCASYYLAFSFDYFYLCLFEGIFYEDIPRSKDIHPSLLVQFLLGRTQVRGHTSQLIGVVLKDIPKSESLSNFFLCVLFITFSNWTQLCTYDCIGTSGKKSPKTPVKGFLSTKPLQRVFVWDPVSSPQRRVPSIVPPQ